MTAIRFGVVVMMMCLNVGTSVLADELAEGRTYFMRYCASCHGPEADGKGFVARAMAKRPPDLRHLGRNSRDYLLGDRISRYIDGREVVPSHGNREMPVWGEQFQDLSNKADEREGQVREHINAIVAYVLSIQVEAKSKH